MEQHIACINDAQEDSVINMKINNWKISIYTLRIVLLVLVIPPILYVSFTGCCAAIPSVMGVWELLAAFCGTPLLIIDLAYNAKLLLLDPLPGRQIASAIVLSLELVALFYYIYYLYMLVYLLYMLALL